MALSSMTGFARASGGDERISWVWEVRSVNGKGLDFRLRVPRGFESLDPGVRRALAERFVRGNFQIQLQLAHVRDAVAMRINGAMLDWLIEEARKLRARLGPEAAPLDASALLAMRGVVEIDEDAQQAELLETHGETLMKGLNEALDALAAARAEEGARLQRAIAARIDRMEALTRQARENKARTPAAIRARLKEQVDRLLEASSGLDAQRLAQEAALLAAKADIAEELDRLDAHVAAARDLLAAEGAVGRRLDFLAQEFNREANTLCSKSTDASLTAIGLEMKIVTDQLREQVQNVE